jgi:serine/threonine-protein kinase
VDPRTDIYSLAVVLYECIAGKVPFDAETLPALSIRIFEGGFEPLAEVAPGVLPGLDELLRRAMAVEPSRRYQTMAAFRAALLGLGECAQISLAPTQPGVPDIGLPGALLLPGSSELPVTRDTSAAKPERVVQWRRLALLGLFAAALLLLLIRGFAARHSGVAVAPDTAPPRDAPRAQVEVRSHGLQALPARTAPFSPSVQPSSALASATSVKVNAPRPARMSTRDPAGPSTAVKDGLSDKNPF